MTYNSNDRSKISKTPKPRNYMVILITIVAIIIIMTKEITLTKTAIKTVARIINIIIIKMA